MIYLYNVLYLLPFLLNCIVSSDQITNDSDVDQCQEICADSFFSLPKLTEAQPICERGCRFFNIIYLKDDHDLNITKEECYLSCNEAYPEKDPKLACHTGCTTMSKKKDMELSSMIVFIEQDNPKNMLLMEPDLELLETELLSDPLIQNQIEVGYNVEYKIPATKIRTMPIEEYVEVSKSEDSDKQSTGDWLDCASRNSGIPKWLLLGAILFALLVALFLSISNDKKGDNDQSDENKSPLNVATAADDDDDALLINDTDDILVSEKLPEKDVNHLDFIFEREVEFSTPPPPKYQFESEKL